MNISAILPSVERPSRYLGTEINARHKDWEETGLHAALVFPDLYEIGMSHLGLQILYSILNDLEWCLADRAYCPDHDMEALMRGRRIPAWGIESRRPLGDFDILAFTLPYELCYVNILTILDLAKIPLLAAERMDGSWPLILGGGSCSLNPEPVADFFDAILAGDGEEAVVEIAQCVKDWKQDRTASKQELLEALSEIEGIYIPSFYRTVPDAHDFTHAEPVHPRAGIVRRRILPALDELPFPSRPLVPYMQIVHDRLGIEIARGCTRGCRFCQAGIIYRPVRERPVEQILKIAAEDIDTTGWDELSLLSLSTGDYSCLFPLIHELMKKQREQHISISLPSLRVGTLTSEIMEEIKSVRKTGLTLAPEAGSERLRRVINKGITEKDLMETASMAYANGWSHMKLYFMIGLPTETMEDVESIATLARMVREQGGPIRGRGRKAKRQVTVSVGTFVPKPHTPFQWEQQIGIDDSRKRINILRDNLRGRAFNVKWHDPRQSFLEGVFSRGDRRLSTILISAWQKGARLDAWTDSMRPDLYIEAGRREGIDLSAYMEARPVDSRLPWDHLSSRVDREYILKERENAWEEAYTTDCRQGKCHRCGVCDFKSIRPVVFIEKPGKAESDGGSGGDRQDKGTRKPPLIPAEKKNASAPARHFCRICYSKTGPARFLGHLEMAHAFHRAARRAGIPVAYSAGFHPMPRVAFGQPLSLGMESLREEAVMELSSPMPAEEVTTRLNASLPTGLEVKEAMLSGEKMRVVERDVSRYLIWFPELEQGLMETYVTRFSRAEELPVERRRKGKTQVIDAKKQVESLMALSASAPSRDMTPEEWSWLQSREKAEGTGRGSALLMLLKKQEGAGLKPHEIAAAATGCCRDMKPAELLSVMQVLKSVMPTQC